MRHDKEAQVELIDLGAASVKTQGLDEGRIEGIGFQMPPSLSDD
jgi:hypothetical protein